MADAHRIGRRASAPLAALAATALAVAALGAAPAAAAPAPDCTPQAVQTRTLLSGQGTLESVFVDARGRLFFTTAVGGGRLMVLDRPGATPRVVAAIPVPGGIAPGDDGTLIVGSGNSIANGTVGDVTPRATLVRVDPDTGAQETYATGLGMANGVVRGPDGAYYGSNDFGSLLDRVSGGQTEHGWARVLSGNGMAIDRAGRFLYVAQTFVPAAIQRVDLARPDRVTTFAAADPADATAGLDGMTRDGEDRLFVTANAAGQVWRVDTNGRICVLVRGLDIFPAGPSAIATGTTTGAFPARNLYVVTFGGDLIEIVGQAAPPVTPPVTRPRLSLTVRPGSVRAGRIARLSFSASARVAGRTRAVAGARVTIAGASAVTDARGRARIAFVPRRRGLLRARVTRTGYRAGAVSVRVRPAGRTAPVTG